jgi:hypothetical protein
MTSIRCARAAEGVVQSFSCDPVDLIPQDRI